MANPPPYPDSHADPGDDTGARPDRESAAGAPRWVKVFGIVAIVLVLLFLVLQFAGGGHGPGRHASSVDTRPSSVTAQAPPEGGRG